ncbi:antitoxin Xre/MbcA/ParS toxin-binding domain-containing protein [Limibacter armeniacum]|uniref:antitoxin Xre/MbcA/ParS toxin-binding domain-containing protein n=1 Tax=Limibacter armeniacum TaxID=466084 RepID=UPI002FE5BC80
MKYKQVCYILGVPDNVHATEHDLIQLARKGLTTEQVALLLEFTALTQSEINHIVPNLNIRLTQPQQRLDKHLSSLLIEIAIIHETGYHLFKYRKEFQRWLHTPLMVLNKEEPISLLDGTQGCRIVSNILYRLQKEVII